MAVFVEVFLFQVFSKNGRILTTLLMYTPPLQPKAKIELNRQENKHPGRPRSERCHRFSRMWQRLGFMLQL